MALFGYPVAQENDSERAARAALSIQRSLSEINRKNASAGKPALNARIGIETGPVVVEAAGEHLRRCTQYCGVSHSIMSTRGFPPKIAVPQFRPTISNWLAMCCLPALISASSWPNGCSS
jgi:Adenylate and Guanylate cyclase catalytic domain